MPVDDHKELRELVTETLQARGVLQKVQAQIRASVFVALEGQEVFKDLSPYINKPLQDYVSTQEGIIAVSLIREFLDFFNLEFSSMVFDPETHAGDDYTYEGRTKLIKDLMIDNHVDNKIPLLGIVVKQLINTIKKNSESSSKTSGKSDISNGSEIISEHSDKLYSNGFNGNSDHKSQNSEESLAENLINLENDKFNTKVEAEKRLTSNDNVGSNSLTSLGNLPPLTKGPQSNLKTDGNNRPSSIKQLKHILDVDPGPDFEEDLLSHSNDKSQNEKKNEFTGSDESEIEDEVSEVVSAATDDNTIDVSISRESGKGDYFEDLQ